MLQQNSVIALYTTTQNQHTQINTITVHFKDFKPDMLLNHTKQDKD